MSEGQAVRLEGPPKFRSAKQSLRSLSRRAETFQIKSASYGSARLAKSDWLLAHFLSNFYQQPVGKKEPKQTKNNAYDRAEASLGTLRIYRHPPDSDPTPDLEQQQHCAK